MLGVLVLYVVVISWYLSPTTPKLHVRHHVPGVHWHGEQGGTGIAITLAGFECTVVVTLPAECGTCDEVFQSKYVSERIPERHARDVDWRMVPACCRGGGLGKVAAGEGEHMSGGGRGLGADGGVYETGGDVFVAGVGPEVRDDAHCNKEGHDDGLPKGEEDAFDTEEFRDGSPEFGETPKCEIYCTRWTRTSIHCERENRRRYGWLS